MYICCLMAWRLLTIQIQKKNWICKKNNAFLCFEKAFYSIGIKMQIVVICSKWFPLRQHNCETFFSFSGLISLQQTPRAVRLSVTTQQVLCAPQCFADALLHFPKTILTLNPWNPLLFRQLSLDQRGCVTSLIHLQKPRLHWTIYPKRFFLSHQKATLPSNQKACESVLCLRSDLSHWSIYKTTSLPA